MVYHVAVEDIEPHHWVAWVLDVPGCFATAPSERAAMGQVREALATYALWRQQHLDPLVLEEPLALQIDERFHSFFSASDYRVNACFHADRLPLTEAEVVEGCRILHYTRHDLLMVLQAATRLDEQIQEVLRHITQAERWYFASLGLEQAALDADVFAALDVVRRQSVEWLEQLAGDATYHERMQEGWTARKVLRRTIWHERDHTGQLRQLTGARAAT